MNSDINQTETDIKCLADSCKDNINHRKRVSELLVGVAVNRFIAYIFDYVLYPFIIYYFGAIKGGVVMTFLVLIICLLTIRLYDWSKRDWLGIETIKRLKYYDGAKVIGQISAWVLRKSDVVIFMFLSAKYDPFVTTVYLRHGSFNGMMKRDWQIFTGSLLFGNLYWITVCYSGVSIVEWAVMKLH